MRTRSGFVYSEPPPVRSRRRTSRDARGTAAVDCLRTCLHRCHSPHRCHAPSRCRSEEWAVRRTPSRDLNIRTHPDKCQGAPSWRPCCTPPISTARFLHDTVITPTQGTHRSRPRTIAGPRPALRPCGHGMRDRWRALTRRERECSGKSRAHHIAGNHDGIAPGTRASCGTHGGPVIWQHDGTEWHTPNGTAPDCPAPLALPAPVDLSFVYSVLYPGQP